MFKVLLKCMVFFIVKVYFIRKKLIFCIQVKHTKKINLPVKPTITNVGSMDKITDFKLYIHHIICSEGGTKMC